MSINRISKYVVPPEASDEFQEAIAAYISSRLECFLEILGQEVRAWARTVDCPLKDVQITIDGLGVAYLPCRDPMKRRKRNG
jgi:hypothetical protein